VLVGYLSAAHAVAFTLGAGASYSREKRGGIAERFVKFIYVNFSICHFQ